MRFVWTRQFLRRMSNFSVEGAREPAGCMSLERPTIVDELQDSSLLILAGPVHLRGKIKQKTLIQEELPLECFTINSKYQVVQ